MSTEKSLGAWPLSKVIWGEVSRVLTKLRRNTSLWWRTQYLEWWKITVFPIKDIFLPGGTVLLTPVCIHLQESRWPFLFGAIIVPSLIQAVILPFLPESPRYLLLEKHNTSKAEKGMICYLGQRVLIVRMQAADTWFWYHTKSRTFQ